MKVIATGRTYPIRGDLKEWGFRWDERHAAWVWTGHDGGEVALFRHNVSSGAWPDVDLEIVEETA